MLPYGLQMKNTQTTARHLLSSMHGKLKFEDMLKIGDAVGRFCKINRGVGKRKSARLIT